MKMKKLIMTMIAILFITILAACGNESNTTSGNENTNNDSNNNSNTEEKKEAEASPIEIEFWHAMSGGHEEALTKITNDFNESNEKNITVKLVNQGSYSDLSTKNMAAARANNLPVLTQAYEDWITEYIQNDLVADLTPLINDQEVGMSEAELTDIVEVFREANVWDGKYYGLPFNKSTRIMFYNVDYLEEAGIEPPTTWEELRDASEKLTFDNEGRKVIGPLFH
ncbi:extracellular solute-binding protein [Sutcliffiella cohnii]|uniref:extracellular solute-binding protein n=1 Tax=Sutcliffiella cohnii TaxID=33932 RepID=UPI00082D610C|nr:extracellular solute-binding protein [Sutcliffiella cohnii]